MPLRSSRWLVTVALVLATLVSIFIIGGLSVRAQIVGSFQQAERVRAMRALALETLRLQLDEESGVRAYSATRDSSFLAAYREAQPLMVADLEHLRRSLARRLPGALPSIVDATSTNATWLETVAVPLVTGAGDASSQEMQAHGNALLDRFRADISATDALLERREREVDANASEAINRIVLLVGGAAAIVAALAYIFTALQLRTMRRLADQSRRTEDQRRTASDLRVAYEAEKRIADTLQEAVFQRALPAVPSMRFSGVYVPATSEARVGGDWYDALELPNGRVMFTIGDVTGHGLDAAVNMSRARQAVIAAALADPAPASVLARANLELLRRDSPLVTAIVGFADAERYEFTYSIAGHPPPILIELGKPPRTLSYGALPLGAVSDAAYDVYCVSASPGAMLVLYTDGALEHTRDVLEGERRLLAAAELAMRGGAADPARIIHDAVFAGSDAGDDVAILTIGFATREAGFTISASDANADFSGRLGRDAAVDCDSRLGARLPGLPATDLERLGELLGSEPQIHDRDDEQRQRERR